MRAACERAGGDRQNREDRSRRAHHAINLPSVLSCVVSSLAGSPSGSSVAGPKLGQYRYRFRRAFRDPAAGVGERRELGVRAFARAADQRAGVPHLFSPARGGRPPWRQPAWESRAPPRQRHIPCRRRSRRRTAPPSVASSCGERAQIFVAGCGRSRYRRRYARRCAGRCRRASIAAPARASACRCARSRQGAPACKSSARSSRAGRGPAQRCRACSARPANCRPPARSAAAAARHAPAHIRQPP